MVKIEISEEMAKDIVAIQENLQWSNSNPDRSISMSDMWRLKQIAEQLNEQLGEN